MVEINGAHASYITEQVKSLLGDEWSLVEQTGQDDDWLTLKFKSAYPCKLSGKGITSKLQHVSLEVTFSVPYNEDLSSWQFASVSIIYNYKNHDEQRFDSFQEAKSTLQEFKTRPSWEAERAKDAIDGRISERKHDEITKQQRGERVDPERPVITHLQDLRTELP